jgi:hypothetical protein
MAQPGEVTMWRAPTRLNPDPLGELQGGFDPANYPGPGLFFATYKPISESFQLHYGNGLQAFFMLETEFKRLVQKGVILPDTYYPSGQSWHVPAAGIPEFNAAMQGGSPGKVYP